ncbi:hypothetical protein Hanom_Chr14g01258041 [Helianthus anomalus]
MNFYPLSSPNPHTFTTFIYRERTREKEEGEGERERAGRGSNDSSLKIVDVPEIVVQVLDLKPTGNRYRYWFGDEDDREGGWSYNRDSYQPGFPAKKVRTNHSLAL